MQHRNSNQSHQGRGAQSGRGARNMGRRGDNWRGQERDEDGRFTDQHGSEDRYYSPGNNDNWRDDERDERGRFTEQGYHRSGHADYGDEDGTYGRARNQGRDYGYQRDREEGGYRNASFDQGGSYGARSQGRSGWQGQDNQFDPDYHHWRNEQIGKLDEDYKAWQGERRQKFSDEFGKWRSERAAKGDKK